METNVLRFTKVSAILNGACVFKVKYKKKRPPKNGQVKMEKTVPSTTASTMTTMKTENIQDNTSSISTLVNGTILKTALTNPSEVSARIRRSDYIY